MKLTKHNGHIKYETEHVAMYAICACGCGTASPTVRGDEQSCIAQLRAMGWKVEPFGTESHQFYAPGHDAKRKPTAAEKAHAKQQQDELKAWLMGWQ